MAVASQLNSQSVMVFMPLEENILQGLRNIFNTVYYHPEFWNVWSWFTRDVEGCQKAFDAVDPDEWKNVEVLLVPFLIPQLKNRKLQLPNLKWIQLRAAGADVIFQQDLLKNEPEGSDLHVVNASGIPSSSIAQHVFMLVLAVFRNLDRYIVWQHDKIWKHPVGLPSFAPDVTQLTWGILGYGSIGRETARLAYGWGARNILACNSSGKKSVDPTFQLEGTGDREGKLASRWFSSREPASFKEFLSSTDILVVAIPSSNHTYHILNAETLSFMKPSAIVVNVGRGNVIDQAALVEALNSGRLAGAGLDVIDPEPPREKDDPILTAKNCILTPHTSTLTDTYWENLLKLIETNVDRFRKGQPMYNVVPYPK